MLERNIRFNGLDEALSVLEQILGCQRPPIRRNTPKPYRTESEKQKKWANFDIGEKPLPKKVQYIFGTIIGNNVNLSHIYDLLVYIHHHSKTIVFVAISGQIGSGPKFLFHIHFTLEYRNQTEVETIFNNLWFAGIEARSKDRRRTLEYMCNFHEDHPTCECGVDCHAKRHGGCSAAAAADDPMEKKCKENRTNYEQALEKFHTIEAYMRSQITNQKHREAMSELFGPYNGLWIPVGELVSPAETEKFNLQKVMKDLEHRRISLDNALCSIMNEPLIAQNNNKRTAILRCLWDIHYRPSVCPYYRRAPLVDILWGNVSEAQMLSIAEKRLIGKQNDTKFFNYRPTSNMPYTSTFRGEPHLFVPNANLLNVAHEISNGLPLRLRIEWVGVIDVYFERVILLYPNQQRRPEVFNLKNPASRVNRVYQKSLETLQIVSDTSLWNISFNVTINDEAADFARQKSRCVKPRLATKGTTTQPTDDEFLANISFDGRPVLRE